MLIRPTDDYLNILEYLASVGHPAEIRILLNKYPTEISQISYFNFNFFKLFLHKLFGYRGVVLFPWTAYVFDKSDDSSTDVSTVQYDKLSVDELDRNRPLERTKAKKLTYYQVLIDSRDIPYVRSMPESVTFLSGSISNRSVYTIHGLDYVSQNDVMPYTSIEKTPIFHGKAKITLKFKKTIF